MFSKKATRIDKIWWRFDVNSSIFVAFLENIPTYVLYLYKEVTVLFIQGDEKKRGKITLRAKIWVDISIVLAPNKVMEEKKTNLVIVGVRIAS